MDVEASKNGIFMSDDGRAFFQTGDPLVPEDINGLEPDVYEFTDNRPQLISSGSAPSARFRGDTVGLMGVSRDGIDVYFSTLDTLVGQDENGSVLKFYDARVNGGFPFAPPAPPCAAADECHGASSSQPGALTVGTQAPLGKGGNAAHKKAKKKKRKRHKNKKKHKKRRQAHRKESR
jgi:hypothetical protein